MPENILATPEQKAAEDRAMALLARPELERARQIVTLLWTNVAAYPTREQADRFDNMIDEYLFHHAMRAANVDANYPQAVRFMAPPHHWFGRDVPGSRWAGDSPDFIYRTIPIAHGGQYRITGRVVAGEPPLQTFSLMGDATAQPVTLTLLDSLDMDLDAQGGFTLTVDASPAEGRKNHLQTKPGSEFLMVRDALGDWLTQSPRALTVERLNPDGDPMGEEAMARHAAKIAIEGVYYTYYCTRSGAGQPPNQIRPPMSSGDFGGMATQWGAKGNLDLAEDQALIVRCNAAGASFRNVGLTDAFHMSIEYWQRTSSFNMQQMMPDEDGDFTFVIAHHDPGVHNWLDTGGLRQTIFGQRWQAFDRGATNDDPWLKFRHVDIDAIDQALPDGVARIDGAGRTAQLAARRAGFDRRFIDR